MPALHSFGRTTEAVWRATCPVCGLGHAFLGNLEPTPPYCIECLSMHGEARKLEWKLDETGDG